MMKHGRTPTRRLSERINKSPFIYKSRQQYKSQAKRECTDTARLTPTPTHTELVCGQASALLCWIEV